MHLPLLTTCLLGNLILTASSISAQVDIILSDSLEFHSEILEAKTNDPVNKNPKFNMGDYTVIVDRKSSHTHSDTKERLLGVRLVTKITKTLSFTISDTSSNMADVTIEERSRVNSYNLNALNTDVEHDPEDGFTYGKFDDASAQISIGGSGEIWTFSSNKVKGNHSGPPVEMLLTEGTKTINLNQVSSDPNFDYSHLLRYLKNMPSMGIEFVEQGKTLCAIQYDSGDVNSFDLRPNQTIGCKVWMRLDLDPKTKLALAATLSTLILMNTHYFSD